LSGTGEHPSSHHAKNAIRTFIQLYALVVAGGSSGTSCSSCGRGLCQRTRTSSMSCESFKPPVPPLRGPPATSTHGHELFACIIDHRYTEATFYRLNSLRRAIQARWVASHRKAARGPHMRTSHNGNLTRVSIVCDWYTEYRTRRGTQTATGGRGSSA
jgi:hypothetical protein